MDPRVGKWKKGGRDGNGWLCDRFSNRFSE